MLRYSGVKNILCNRVNTVNFDKALSNGEITFICTRRGDLGPNIHQAFGLFCILMLQYSVLRRPGTEKDRVPHFFYVDEFSDFVGNVTDPLFTIYRKYKVSTVVSVQNLAQLDGADKNIEKLSQLTVLTNLYLVTILQKTTNGGHKRLVMKRDGNLVILMILQKVNTSQN